MMKADLWVGRSNMSLQWWSYVVYAAIVSVFFYFFLLFWHPVIMLLLVLSNTVFIVSALLVTHHCWNSVQRLTWKPLGMRVKRLLKQWFDSFSKCSLPQWLPLFRAVSLELLCIGLFLN